MDDQEEVDDVDRNRNYEESYNQTNDHDDQAENNPQDLLAAAGLEDSDAEDDTVISLSSLGVYMFSPSTVTRLVQGMERVIWSMLGHLIGQMSFSFKWFGRTGRDVKGIYFLVPI